jgi:Ca-activated chloride channel homolog
MYLDPLALALTLISVILFVVRWNRYPAKSPQVRIATFDCLAEGGFKSGIPFHTSIILRLIACLILIVIYARESALEREVPQDDRGSALAIALDISTSMTADDFAPGNRLEEAKASLTEFIASQSQVEISLIQFAASPRVVVPATLEHKSLTNALANVQPADFAEDGTAIGTALASAVNRLRHGPWSKRRILLLTDGVNNKGAISPADAAKIAKSLQVSIDAIGIGTDASSRYWISSAAGNAVQFEARIQIDDDALEGLTQATGGTYQRVRNTDELRRALSKLRQGPDDSPLNTAPSDRRINWTQLAALAALGALCLEFLITNYFFAELPE